jgi:hypothetical protein
MITFGSLSISLAEVLGLIVTIVGVWFVVKQLNETRLASQMEGLIALMEIETNMEGEVSELREFTLKEEWDEVSDNEAFSLVMKNDNYRRGYLKYIKLYELIGVLVRTKALDERFAFEQFGQFLPMMWRRLERIVKGERQEEGLELIGEHWEWLTKRMEKKIERRTT